jgi:predicted AlkP superfamily phosphohydrolase/phosphomutase
MSRRVFLLGLDGGSWNLIDRMFTAGAMPNLQRLCAEGTRAVLESTVPPITPVAWTTLMTGVNPGKHGIFGFLKHKSDDSYLQAPINRLDIQAPTIFDYMREGGRLVSLNLPMSYPATPINGLMVTGMMTPLRATQNAQYPVGLLERFRAAGIDYTIDPKFALGRDVPPVELMSGWQKAGARFVAELAQITRNRLRAAYLLMQEEQWQVFICVIVGTDRLQHVFWHQLMQGEAADIDPVLKAYYEEVDRQIGDLQGRLSPEDSLLIVSDHGFTACRGTFYVNEWLRRHGWLVSANTQSRPLVRLKNLVKKLGISRRSFRGVLSEKQLGRLHLVLGDIDHPRTSAYFASSCGVRLNLIGREAQGRVAPAAADDLRCRVMAALADLTDPDGRKVVDRVWRREDLYTGPAAAAAPDIIFTFREDALYGAYASDLGKGPFLAAPYKSGDHRLDGIFVACGGGIRRHEGEPRFHIQDVLPTLLHLCGRAVSSVCDGRVLGEILTDPAPVRVDDEWERFLADRGEVTYDADQEAEIKERLQALGYMSDDGESPP